MKGWRTEEKKTTNIKAKIIDFKSQQDYYPGLISVKQVELKAQNFKNKTIKQSYQIDLLPYMAGLYINKINIYIQKTGFQRFENSALYYTYNLIGHLRPSLGISYKKKELNIFNILNKDLFKLKKSKEPLKLLSQLFENSLDTDLNDRALYPYYADTGILVLTDTNYEKEYTAFSTIYSHIWRKFILEKYKDKVTNLNLEMVNKYNIYGLCKLQAILDLSELGYKLEYKVNPLENVFYYLKTENQYFNFLSRECFIYYLNNIKQEIEKGQENTFLKNYIKFYEPNKFTAPYYTMFLNNASYGDLTRIHFLHKYYNLFDLKLFNDSIIYGDKHFYISNYCFLEGPCLTASLELQKLKNLNLCGIKIKNNSLISKLNLEQLSLLGFTLSADLF